MADGMMNRARLNPARVTEATPLLQFLAGPHAGAIASVWPAPHRDFLALPAARRHAAAILLARGERDLAGLALAVERHKDGALAKRLAHGRETAGLMKALARLGETLWTTEQYTRFLGLFDSPRANRILRHMDQIKPEQLAVVHALPSALHEATVVANVPSAGAARDLRLALDLAGRVHDAASAQSLVKALVKARDTASLFAKAADALAGEVFMGPGAAPDLPVPFARVRSASELDKIALQFQNCLRDFKADMVMGRMVAYVWNGPPEIVLALRWDPAGWRLAEAELCGNEEAPDQALHDVVDALAIAGVRTGPSTFTLASRLRRYPYGDPQQIGETWRDGLELGDLWD